VASEKMKVPDYAAVRGFKPAISVERMPTEADLHAKFGQSAYDTQSILDEAKREARKAHSEKQGASDARRIKSSNIAIGMAIIGGIAALAANLLIPH
jgi:hypothetical protein